MTLLNHFQTKNIPHAHATWCFSANWGKQGDQLIVWIKRRRGGWWEGRHAGKVTCQRGGSLRAAERERHLRERGTETEDTDGCQTLHTTNPLLLHLHAKISYIWSELSNLHTWLNPRWTKWNRTFDIRKQPQRPCCSLSWLVRIFRISVSQATFTSTVGAWTREAHTHTQHNTGV